MNVLLENLKIKVTDKLFLKDPETSELGKKIIQNSILLIDEIGLEQFTFKKLGEKIGSNESSIYRYFENKHKLVMYLSSWYWAWLEYKLVFGITNIPNPVSKLEKAINIVTETIVDDETTSHINESILNKIIIAEFNKALYTKDVDEDEKEGSFLAYKNIINRIASIISEINPSYEFSNSLASTIIEGSLHQHFLNDHIQSITNCNKKNSVTLFFLDLTKRVLNT